MKKIYYLAGISLSICFCLLFVYLRSSDDSGKVLGSSINSFYQKKSVNAQRPPQRKDGIKDPVIYADYAVLIDDKSKYPIYQKDSEKAVPIASITKVMTAMVVLDSFKDLGQILEVSSEASSIEGSKVGLKSSEKISVENLLYGLMMNSGNDAANVFAENMGGVEKFVEKMNEKARQIGMEHTTFRDPAGLDDDGRSTAFDIAILFSYALKNETFKQVVNTAEKEISSEDGSITHALKNSNRLVTNEVPFDGVIGGKTGFTFAAGHGLVCAAQNEGLTLVSVVLKTHSSKNEASALESRKLLSWGFESFIF
ncbi:MAG: D-alanyl-D-alanine carboxypeptidase DacB precursor [candidate division WS2 bacterium ADurb.Bin280]|uniref:D-alanyl-D-alanine carboxypeptidase DacB n=1 Tax=candidate division WS2 bacterium ADurb.Bin280 TaxID=1852829 RepID=A0A1V5SBS7_9BACT|nr:MAG: D-alanyl-D-alanine carboxypeptidase DacB precursor [candidate division WS2 bacterium ADurb.Bin280]